MGKCKNCQKVKKKLVNGECGDCQEAHGSGDPDESDGMNEYFDNHNTNSEEVVTPQIDQEFWNQMNRLFDSKLATLEKKIAENVLEEVKKITTPIQTEMSKLQKENKDLKTAAKKSQGKITDLENKVQSLEQKEKDGKKVVDNTLKYLINSDRNDRKFNIMVFGVPELKDGEVEIEDESLNSDHDVCKRLFRFIGQEGVIKDVKEVFRTGVEGGDKTRPIKVRFSTKDSAFEVLKNTGKLRTLQNHKIFMKPDKTAAERAEFQRIGKKKDELLTKYPTEDDQQPRVTLKKGILMVDNVKVDEYKAPQTLF